MFKKSTKDESVRVNVCCTRNEKSSYFHSTSLHPSLRPQDRSPRSQFAFAFFDSVISVYSPLGRLWSLKAESKSISLSLMNQRSNCHATERERTNERCTAQTERPICYISFCHRTNERHARHKHDREQSTNKQGGTVFVLPLVLLLSSPACMQSGTEQADFKKAGLFLSSFSLRCWSTFAKRRFIRVERYNFHTATFCESQASTVEFTVNRL